LLLNRTDYEYRSKLLMTMCVCVCARMGWVVGYSSSDKQHER